MLDSRLVYLAMHIPPQFIDDKDLFPMSLANCKCPIYRNLLKSKYLQVHQFC